MEDVSPAYHARMRELQDRYDTRLLADRLDETLARTEFSAGDRAFIERFAEDRERTHVWELRAAETGDRQWAAWLGFMLVAPVALQLPWLMFVFAFALRFSFFRPRTSIWAGPVTRDLYRCSTCRTTVARASATTTSTIAITTAFVVASPTAAK